MNRYAYFFGVLAALMSSVSAQEQGCLQKCVAQGRVEQFCNSICRGGQAPSIQIKPANFGVSQGVNQGATQSSIYVPGQLQTSDSPEVLRAKCVMQRDIASCRQLQGTTQAGENAQSRVSPVVSQQINQKLQAENIPEALRNKCLVELDLKACKDIDELMAGKK
jgi:hypothetical protein